MDILENLASTTKQQGGKNMNYNTTSDLILKGISICLLFMAIASYPKATKNNVLFRLWMSILMSILAFFILVLAFICRDEILESTIMFIVFCKFNIFWYRKFEEIKTEN